MFHEQKLEFRKYVKKTKDKWILEDIIPVGLTLLASESDIATQLVLQLSLDVLHGKTEIVDKEIQQGNVLFLCYDSNIKENDSFKTHTNWPKSVEAIPRIDTWIKNTYNPKLIVIDTFSCFYRNGKSSLYDSDAAITVCLNRLALTHHIAIVVTHYLNKTKHTNKMKMINGSNVVLSATTSNIVAENKDKCIDLYISSRIAEFKKIRIEK